MASAANNQTITTSSTRIFNATNDGGKCAKFFIGCRSTSAVPVLVNIPGFHEVDEWLGLPAGSSIEFTSLPMGFADIRVKGSGGSATVDYGVTERVR